MPQQKEKKKLRDNMQVTQFTQGVYIGSVFHGLLYLLSSYPKSHTQTSNWTWKLFLLPKLCSLVCLSSPGRN